MKALLAFVYLMLGAGILWAQYEPPALNEWDANSPDKLYLASTRIIPDPVKIWKTDLDTGRLVVVRLNDLADKATYVSYDLGRLIAHIEWSPDSKFLVMTTVSAGGHSPWHFESYAYCLDDKSLRYMDDVVGPLVDAKFEFVGPHTVKMKIAGPNNDFETPVSANVDLGKKALLMKKQNGKKEGKAWD
jgi:hypothetical protein